MNVAVNWRKLLSWSPCPFYLNCPQPSRLAVERRLLKLEVPVAEWQVAGTLAAHFPADYVKKEEEKINDFDIHSCGS